MNEQPSPQVPQTTPLESTNQEKELADAAIQAAGAAADVPAVEIPAENTSTAVDSALTSAVEGVESTESTAPSAPTEEEATTSDPLTSSPVPSVTIPEIPVNDSTVATSEPAPIENSSSDTSAPASEVPVAPSPETNTPPASTGTEPAAFGNAAPAKPEGFMAKFLGIFKK